MLERSSARTALVALVIAVAAAGTSLYALVRRPASGDATATLAASDRGSDERDRPLRALEARLALVESRMRSLEGAVKRGGRSPEDRSAAPDEGAADDAPTRPRLLRFDDLPATSVQVVQTENGSLQVTNTDATLTGRVLSITGIDETGGEHPMTITVPPPAP